MGRGYAAPPSLHWANGRATHRRRLGRLGRLLRDAATARSRARGAAARATRASRLPSTRSSSASAAAPIGGSRVRDIAEQIGWEKSRVSHQVTRMERRGLVRRSDCDVRRARHLGRADGDGRRAMLEASRGHNEAIRRYFVDALGGDADVARGVLGPRARRDRRRRVADDAGARAGLETRRRPRERVTATRDRPDPTADRATDGSVAAVVLDRHARRRTAACGTRSPAISRMTRSR